MGKIWHKEKWIVFTILGSTLFALGFALFLESNDINSGGISGLAMVLQRLLGVGSVGTLSILINIPLFIVGGVRIGKRFFAGSMLGMFFSSVMIDALAPFAIRGLEPMIAAVYGGCLCGLGLGIVFSAGTSTGGSDIVVRLLKLRYRNVPIGSISMSFDAVVVVLTGLVFQDITKALYSGIVVYITGQIMDVVVYRFDYSKVALIISSEHVKIAEVIGRELGRGATYLHGEGSYTNCSTKVILTVVKKRQLSELKELVMAIDANAFVIVQEAHQVLGDGFSHYSRDAL